MILILVKGDDIRSGTNTKAASRLVMGGIGVSGLTGLETMKAETNSENSKSRVKVTNKS